MVIPTVATLTLPEPEAIVSEAAEVASSVGPALAIGLGVAAVALVVQFVLFWLLFRIAKRSDTSVDDVLLRQLNLPCRLLFPLIAVLAVVPALGLTDSSATMVRRIVGFGIVLSAAWMLSRVVRAVTVLVLKQYDIDVADNKHAREVHTRVGVMSRISHVLIMVIGIAAALMVFPTIRQFGASLLASAGIGALILGLAAQRVIGNFLAGLQIALTQPIRLDDVVVIAGEWGRIEEITSTYVVVKVWDQRRLIVPFSKIIEEPFENWSRDNTEILGRVFLHADYTVPVSEVRAKVKEFAEEDQDWDGRLANLVVTEAGPQTVELRALLSAEDGGKAWDLRCRVREKLVEWLQREYPESLPVQREIERKVDSMAAESGTRGSQESGERS